MRGTIAKRNLQVESDSPFLESPFRQFVKRSRPKVGEVRSVAFGSPQFVTESKETVKGNHVELRKQRVACGNQF